MINLEMAADYLRRSLSCLDEAKNAMMRRDFPLCVRRSQEALEMSLKALLRMLSIEYPRSHDVGPVLLSVKERLPEDLAREAEELARLSKELASIRGPAMYGLEVEGLPPSRLISSEYARDVLNRTERAVELVASHLIPVLREKGFW